MEVAQLGGYSLRAANLLCRPLLFVNRFTGVEEIEGEGVKSHSFPGRIKSLNGRKLNYTQYTSLSLNYTYTIVIK